MSFTLRKKDGMQKHANNKMENAGEGEEMWGRGEVMEGLVKLGYQGVLSRLGWVFDFVNNRQFQLFFKNHFRTREPLVPSI
jgi:hypothetical protein